MENKITLSTFDSESYPNYFLLSFKELKTKTVRSFEIRGEDNTFSDEDILKMKWLFHNVVNFGFNSFNYDLCVIFYALQGKTPKQICKLSNDIIKNGMVQWIACRDYFISIPETVLDNHFDLKEPAPGVGISLKLYGGRVGSRKLQDLPIEPNTYLTEEQMNEIKTYCENDLDTNIDLYRKIKPMIKLRSDMSEKYGQNLLSKSDAQIAEAVIKSEIERIRGSRIYKPDVNLKKKLKYKAPSYVKFESDELNEVLNLVQDIEYGLKLNGNIDLPKELLNKIIKINGKKYKFGVGGLHSQEKKQIVVPKDDELLLDRDVASYYPRMILNQRLYPKHLGETFLKVYENIVDERLEAKKAGNKVISDSLKIVINGSFGKFGNKYSTLYSPELLIATTITGQLLLLMLIERIENAGIEVFSANTDGVVSLVKKKDYKKFDMVCFDWELDTNLDLEETSYKGLYSRDVNNYFAVTDKGSKGKGIFVEGGLMKNPSGFISVEAAMKYLTEGIPIEETIKAETDINKFIWVRKSNSGAMFGCLEEYLGKVVRWIYSTQGETIFCKGLNVKGNHNKVAKSDGSRPIMELEPLPDDLDYKRYINESIDVLKTLGVNYNE